MSERIKVGPFEWQLDADEDGHRHAECWDLVQPEGLKLTFWSLKNYGGTPNDKSGFSGWRLVSGGPFTSAGGWTTRDDAMRGVISWLLAYYRADVAKKIEEAKRATLALTAILDGIKGVAT